MFKYIVLGSAIFIATCAALFSVTGIVQLFAGHAITVAFAAVSMELGKVVSVSLLYRYKGVMSRWYKIGLSSMLVTLVFITSFGIYAYLASSYAGAASGIKGKENTIALYTSQKSNIESDITRLSQRSTQLQQSRSQQENRLDSLIAKGRSTTSQQVVIRAQDNEIIDIQKQIRSMSATRDSISTQIVSTTNGLSSEGKLGTFYYIAQAFGVSLDFIVKWFILILIFVFDPLSILLFFGYNIIVKKESDGDNARASKKRATLPGDPIETLEKSSTSELPQMSEAALEEVKPLDKPENITIQLDETPYYMDPLYNWKEDHRWHNDVTAQMYLSRLGNDPTT
jgi:hypothetical protein